MLPFRVAGGCVIVRVRLTPKSSLDAVGEITPTADGPAIAMRVRALPSDGEANAAVIRLFAGWVGVPQRDVRLTAGAKGRIKSLTIDGDPVRLAELIAQKFKPSTA
jgi:uncharacterized protein